MWYKLRRPVLMNILPSGKILIWTRGIIFGFWFHLCGIS
jgi:hypothetical protein